MAHVRTTADLLALGRDGHAVARLVAAGELVRLRQGGYVDAAAPNGHQDRHRQLIALTRPLLHPVAVLSHASAAVLHGLPVPAWELQRVHVIRNRNSGGRRHRAVHVHPSPAGEFETTMVDSYRVTDVGRTVVDLTRSLPTGWAVAVADGALALGYPVADLAGALEYADRRPGVRKARAAVAFADPRAESPGESISRVRIAEHGLPVPDLQHVIRTPRGAFVARTDFAWPAFRVVGEFDGEVKYTSLLRPGETVADVLRRQQTREDAVSDLGWRVVRWGWEAFGCFDAVADLLRHALTRTAA